MHEIFIAVILFYFKILKICTPRYSWNIVNVDVIHQSNSQSTMSKISAFMTVFDTKVTQRVPLVDQELLTLQEYLISSTSFSVVRVARTLVLCVIFVGRCLYFFFFWPLWCLSFELRTLIPASVSSNYA